MVKISNDIQSVKKFIINNSIYFQEADGNKYLLNVKEIYINTFEIFVLYGKGYIEKVIFYPYVSMDGHTWSNSTSNAYDVNQHGNIVGLTKEQVLKYINIFNEEFIEYNKCKKENIIKSRINNLNKDF